MAQNNFWWEFGYWIIKALGFRKYSQKRWKKKTNLSFFHSAAGDTCKGWHLFFLVNIRKLGVLWGTDIFISIWEQVAGDLIHRWQTYLSITRVSFLYVLIVIEKKFLWRSIKLRLKLPICFPYSIKHGIFSLHFASWRYYTVAKMKDGHKPISQKWQDDPGMARLISENVWKFKAVSTKESSPLRLQWLLQ